MPNYTKKNVSELEDQAVGFGVGEIQEARFGAKELGCERTGFGHQRIKPNKRQAFGHRHQDAEEVYFVVSGSGSLQMDDENVELAAKDVVRVAPDVARRFEAGPEGLELLAFGALHEGDGEILQEFWAE